MSLTEHWKRKVVVLAMAFVIALSPLVFSPSGESTVSPLIPSAFAHKVCSNNSHYHNYGTTGHRISYHWWVYNTRPAGPNQLAKYWKSKRTGFFTQAHKEGFKTC